MSKPYTAENFITQITEDRNWRIREISDLKAVINRSDDGMRKVLLRALVAICYAHWEGYIKFSAKKYFEHISLRKIQYKNLDGQFFKNYFLPRLAALSVSKTSIAERCALIDQILNSADQKFTRVNEDLVNTKSNLNFEVFAEICLMCGVLAQDFNDFSGFIDIMLLKRRNSIAHGEETMVSFSELDDITSKTIELMRKFGNLLENRVVMEEYKI